VALLALGGSSLKPTVSLFVALSSWRIAFLACFASYQSNGRFTYLGYQPIDGSECHDFPEKKLDKENKGNLRGIAMGFFTNLRVSVTNGFERNGDISR
jgi:hypothetical protein